MTRPGPLPNIGRMDTEIGELEQKVDALLQYVATLKADNAALRTRVAALEQQNRELSGKVATAVTRVEQVLAMLPQAMES